MRRAILLGLALAAATGCHSTDLVVTWKDQAAMPARFQKVIVLFVAPDGALRRSAEDRLASRIPNATQAYKVIPDAELTDREYVREHVAAQGFDGAVIMRPVSVTIEPDYAPGLAWYSGPYDLWGYWSTSWAGVSAPYYANEVVTVESGVYSVKDNKLVWAARSETFNPSSLNKLIDSILRHAVKRMEKEGVIL